METKEVYQYYAFILYVPYAPPCSSMYANDMPLCLFQCVGLRVHVDAM